MTQTFVYITTQKEFIHHYDNAPDEVSYLRYPHRHVAHIKVKIEVFHNDREIEFIMFKHLVDNFLSGVCTDTSCENIASQLLVCIQQDYGLNRDISIVVSEDAENGCELIYRKDTGSL